MTRWHLRPHRKSTGGLLNSYRKKKRYERGSKFLESKLGEHRNKIVTCTGGNVKTKLISADKVNVAKKGKARQVKIESVLENPTNPDIFWFSFGRAKSISLCAVFTSPQIINFFPFAFNLFAYS